MHSCFFSLFGYNLLIRIKSKFLPIAFFFFQLVQSHLLKPLSSHCLLSPPHLLLLNRSFLFILSPSQEDPSGEGNGYPLQYSCLGRFRGQRSLVRLQSTGSQRVRHD